MLFPATYCRLLNDIIICNRTVFFYAYKYSYYSSKINNHEKDHHFAGSSNSDKCRRE